MLPWIFKSDILDSLGCWKGSRRTTQRAPAEVDGFRPAKWFDSPAAPPKGASTKQFVCRWWWVAQQEPWWTMGACSTKIEMLHINVSHSQFHVFNTCISYELIKLSEKISVCHAELEKSWRNSSKPGNSTCFGLRGSSRSESFERPGTTCHEKWPKKKNDGADLAWQSVRLAGAMTHQFFGVTHGKRTRKFQATHTIGKVGLSSFSSKIAIQCYSGDIPILQNIATNFTRSAHRLNLRHCFPTLGCCDVCGPSGVDINLDNLAYLADCTAFTMQQLCSSWLCNWTGSKYIEAAEWAVESWEKGMADVK